MAEPRYPRAVDTSDPVHIRLEHPDSPTPLDLVAQYTAHLSENVPGGFDCATDAPPPDGAFEPPRGVFLVMHDGAQPVGCGAMWEMEPGIAEIRRMWVVPSRHGRGLGRRMLQALENAALEMGCRTARLDSMHSLTAAVAMYRSQGYSEIAPYNANPNATIWMERDLRS